ncbi:MAG: SWIM zinc finger family protein [Clostridia bacterium]|nr:SWIM zinc finger family protein [Clostridia bacterium]
MLNLYSFEDSIDSDVLKRGYDYFVFGHVQNIAVSNGTAHIKVSGSKKYDVYINFDEDYNIISSDCDCPYEYGVYCKHEVAAMYALRAYIDSGKLKAEPDLRELLKKLKKGDLVDTICELAAPGSNAEKRLLLKLGPEGESVDSYIDTVKQYIDLAIVDDYVTGETLDDALEGAYLVIGKAEKLIPKDCLKAAEILAGVLEIVSDLEVEISEEGDFYGEYYTFQVGYNIPDYECPDEIYDVIESIYEMFEKIAPYDENRCVFDMLCKKMSNSINSCYYDVCERFCKDPENRKRFEKILSRIKDDEERLTRTYQLIESHDNDEERDGFLDEHLEINSFRDISINNTMKHGEYDRVIELARNADVSSHYFSDMWNKKAYATSKETGNVKLQKEYLVEFIKHGEIEYTDNLRKICSEDEYAELRKEISDYLKDGNRHRYVEFLKRENMTDELFALCVDDEKNILTLFEYFTKKHRAEAIDMFYRTVMAEADRINGRPNYNSLCNIILQFGAFFGNDEKQKIINELKITQKKRSAFIDELSRIEKIENIQPHFI